MSPAHVHIRALENYDDCIRIGELTAAAFPEEVAGAGLKAWQWTEIEGDYLFSNPWLWKNVGIACEGDKMLGAVVLLLGSDRQDRLTYRQLHQRVGCLPTFWTIMYDRVLVEKLKPQECLIEFIAVTPDARGKGVGKMLMRWAEDSGSRLAIQTSRETVQQSGAHIVLWVGSDNEAAVRLYKRCGYEAVRHTRNSRFSWLMAHVHRAFLGYPHWTKMVKVIPAKAIPVAPPMPDALIPTAAPALASIADRISEKTKAVERGSGGYIGGIQLLVTAVQNSAGSTAGSTCSSVGYQSDTDSLAGFPMATTLGNFAPAAASEPELAPPAASTELSAAAEAINSAGVSGRLSNLGGRKGKYRSIASAKGLQQLLVPVPAGGLVRLSSIPAVVKSGEASTMARGDSIKAVIPERDSLNTGGSIQNPLLLMR